MGEWGNCYSTILPTLFHSDLFSEGIEGIPLKHSTPITLEEEKRTSWISCLATMSFSPDLFISTSAYSLVVQLVKNPPVMQETWVWSLGWEDPLEKGKATYPLQYSGLENSMDYTVHGVAKSRTQTEWLSQERGACSYARIQGSKVENPALFSGKAAPKSRKARRPCSTPTTADEVRAITAYTSTQQSFCNVYVKTLEPHILG